MLTRTLLCFLLLSYTKFTLAQERGNIVLPFKKSQASPLKGDSGKRKAALVVGISDYSSKNLTLKYANKDAALMFDYLVGTRKFPKENIFLLPDSMATSGRIYNSIHDLMKWLVAGDELVLYFAGHGDVQTVADFDEAFFLAWDASDSRNYYGSSGTLKLADLDNYTSRLAGVKNVNVSLIMDACHAGFDLRKDGVLKAQENISTGFNKINKLLGCAVNEFSYEADSIGHGLFSWYLVQGLMGLADAPSDNNVTFDELKLFTQKRVAAASRGKQNPVITAQDGAAVFAEVSVESRAAALALIANKTYSGLMASRGTAEEDTLISAQLQTYIDRYNQFLLTQQLYNEDSSCLSVIYDLAKLSNNSAREIKEGLQNHLAEALETRSQLVLNEYLKGKSEQPAASIYLQASVEAGLADSLLADGDPRKKNDQVMAHFHEAFSYLRYDNFEKFPLAEKLLREALAIEDRAAYLYVTMSYLMSYQNKYDSAIYFAKKAEAIIPTWTVPKNILGNLYSNISQWDKAIGYHQAVLKMDSSFVWSYNNLGTVMLDMDRIGEAEKYFMRSLQMKKNSGKERLDRDWAITYGNLGVIFKERGLDAVAEKYFLMADSIDRTYGPAARQISKLYASIDAEKAAVWLKKAIAIVPFDAENYYDLAELNRNNLQSRQSILLAQDLYLQAIKLNPFDESYYIGLGYLATEKQTADSALFWFQKAIQVSRGSANAYYNLGFHYGSIKQYDSAIANYKKALLLNPYNIDIASDFADLLLEHGDSLQALQELNKMAVLQQLSPKAFYVLGNFFFKTGALNEAIAAYKKCIAVDPSYSNALNAMAHTSLLTREAVSSRYYLNQLQKLDGSPALLLQYNDAVVEQAFKIPIAKRSAWLAGFMPHASSHEALNEILAEADYLANLPLQKTFANLQRAENNLDYNSTTLIKWLFVIGIETADAPTMKKLAQRYLDEVLNTEPELYAMARKLTGDATLAREAKKAVQPADLLKYRSNFKKLFEAI